MTNEEARPDPCLRCKSDIPLTETPRRELYFYTARVSVTGEVGSRRMEIDTDQHPSGRLCDGCTKHFVQWLDAQMVDVAVDVVQRTGH